MFTSVAYKPWLQVNGAQNVECKTMVCEGMVCESMTAENIVMGPDTEIECHDIKAGGTLEVKEESDLQGGAKISGMQYPVVPGNPAQLLATNGIDSFIYVNAPPPSADGVGNIIWREGDVTLGNLVGTWAEVVSWIGLTHGGLKVYVDDSLAPCVVDINTDCEGRVTFCPYQNFSDSKPVLNFNDGNYLLDPQGFTGQLIIAAETSSVGNIHMSDGAVLSFDHGAILTNSALNGAVAIQVAAGEKLTIVLTHGAGFDTGSALLPPPIVHVPVGSELILVTAGVTDASVFSGASISTVPGSTMTWTYDSSKPALDESLINGAKVEVVMGKAENVFYNGATVPLPAADNNIQAQVDQIKRILQNQANMPGDFNLNNHNIFDVNDLNFTHAICSIISPGITGEVVIESPSLGTGPWEYKMPNSRENIVEDSKLNYSVANGVEFKQLGTIYSMYGSRVLANTFAEQSLLNLGAGVGGVIIPANTLEAGSTFTFEAGGAHTATNPDRTLILRFYFGAVPSGDSTLQAPVGANEIWSLNAKIVFISTTQYKTQLAIHYGNKTNFTNLLSLAGALDPTVDNAFDFRGSWDNNDDSITNVFAILDRNR